MKLKNFLKLKRFPNFNQLKNLKLSQKLDLKKLQIGQIAVAALLFLLNTLVNFFTMH